MYDIYNDELSEVVLLVNAENEFNLINGNIMLHNISVLYPILSTYVSNCYQSAVHLFLIGGKEILSKEGTSQGNSTSIGPYALGVTPLLRFLHEFILINEQKSKEIAFAHDLRAAGSIKKIKQYWELSTQVSPKYDYYPKPSKSHLIVKEKHFDIAKFIFKGREVKIANNGQRFLGAAIGSKKNSSENISNQW